MVKQRRARPRSQLLRSPARSSSALASRSNRSAYLACVALALGVLGSCFTAEAARVLQGTPAASTSLATGPAGSPAILSSTPQPGFRPLYRFNTTLLQQVERQLSGWMLNASIANSTLVDMPLNPDSAAAAVAAASAAGLLNTKLKPDTVVTNVTLANVSNTTKINETMLVTKMDKQEDEPSTAAKSSNSGKGYLVYAKAAGRVSPFANLDSTRLTIDGMDDMVLPKGYPLEKHITVTGNGYVLVSFRIPFGRSKVSKPGSGVARQPVLLIHGISLASTCWVVNSDTDSLAFILANQGYDVWMMNTRGNTFSRGHETYPTSDSNYWRFSMDEMATQDLPAILQYIRAVTGAAKVHIVGHSQGATLALAMLADKPSLGSGVGLTVALAPVVYVKYIQSQVMVAFCIQSNTSLLYRSLPSQEFLFMAGPTQALFLNGVCQVPITTPTCVAATESMFGGSSHISTLQYKRYWQAWPSATSYWNALQWGQLYNEPRPRFMRFNYGAEYDLRAIKNPFFLVSGGVDVLSAPRDIALTRSMLQQASALVGTHHIADYSHMDFIWDTSASNSLYPVISNALSRYTS